MIKTTVGLFELDHAINMDQFSKIFTTDIKKVINVVQRYGFDIRVVGGAVRDFLLGKSPRDVDFATNADPAELIFIFDLENIDYDSSGIKHGTIKAKFGDNLIDVTSITYKLKLKNHNIEITRHHSWEQDSLSRDVTINSMSVDMHGNLYDYQNAYLDLKKQLIKFCPGVVDKIQQDPFTILRWFKAIMMFSSPKWLKKDKKIIEKYQHLVEAVKSDDRTAKFLASLVQSKNSTKILELMCNTGVGSHLDINCNILR